MKTKIIMLMALSCMIPTANALVEIRAGYGMTTGDPSQLNNNSSNAISGASATKSMAGLNADVLVNLPMIPIGFGLRYESLSDSKSSTLPGGSGGIDTKVNFDRLALLLNYRIIDTLAYFGPIATFGLVNTAKFTIDCPVCAPAVSFSGKADSASSYSVGLEGGAKLLSFRVGAEAGYASYVAKDYTSNGSVFKDYQGSNMKVDMTGVYAKFLVGLGF